MSSGKKEGAAVALFGEQAYRAIPKSVFAVAAYYLADIDSESGVGHGQAIERLREEIRVLGGQVICPDQANRALKALDKAPTPEA